MNYIELIRNFWRSHERYLFGTTEIALYFHLIEICNICNWENPFHRNNARINADLGITLNTLKTSRNKLKQANLIDFEARQGNPNVKYKLIILRSSNFDEVSNDVSIEVDNDVSTKLTPIKDKQNKTKLNKEDIGEKPNRFLPPSKIEVVDFFMSMEELKPSEAEEAANSFYSHYSKNKWAGVEDWHGLAKDWKQTPATKTKSSFTPPTVANVFEYLTTDRGLSIQDAEYWANRFVDFYTSKGWKVGNQSMKDWKAAARNCVQNWDDKRQRPGYTHPAANYQKSNLKVDERF